jgi:hypothetical protein
VYHHQVPAFLPLLCCLPISLHRCIRRRRRLRDGWTGDLFIAQVRGASHCVLLQPPGHAPATRSGGAVASAFGGDRQQRAGVGCSASFACVLCLCCPPLIHARPALGLGGVGAAADDGAAAPGAERPADRRRHTPLQPASTAAVCRRWRRRRRGRAASAAALPPTHRRAAGRACGATHPRPLSFSGAFHAGSTCMQTWVCVYGCGRR